MTENKADHSQNHISFRDKVGESLLNNKASILGAILFVAFIGQILKFTFPDLLFWGIPLALLAIWLISWLKKVGWSDIGLSRPESWSKTIKLALVAMLIVQIIGTLQFFLSKSPQDLSSYQEAMTPWGLLGWIVIAWTTAAFGEEIIYRGFYMKQIARLFGEQKSSSWVIGLVLSSIGFGLVHFHQGLGGMLGAGFIGLVYGIFYLRSGRNLWVTIIAHGLTGTTTFILLYLSQLQ
ncbi:MAG: lysostaphin resistance A-like protein [Anaerolineales bacterium]